MEQGIDQSSFFGNQRVKKKKGRFYGDARTQKNNFAKAMAVLNL